MWAPSKIVAALVATALAAHAYRPRILVLSDIANEPDDAESLVRLLLYSNELDIEGIVATTSNWLRTATHPEQMRGIIEAYGEVHSNLLAHSSTYPPASSFTVLSSIPEFGMAGVGEGKDSEGSDFLISVVDKEDERPVFVQLWGGANCLAQAIYKVNATRSAAELQAFLDKMMVYSISDQDNAGPWIRRNYPSLSYIASVHAANQYGLAAWSGISGDNYYRFIAGDKYKISMDWVKKYIQLGPLGAKYPNFDFIMEGDTPAFLGTIPNGLNNPLKPTWGGWGGRYGSASLEGDISGHLVDSPDTVMSPVDGLNKTSSQATIWRWRDAVQNDFASRMQWSLKSSYAEANHPPKVIVNGNDSDDALIVECNSGDVIHLDASKSYDPDGNKLSFKWYQYKEVDAFQANVEWEVPTLDFFSTETTSSLKVALPENISFFFLYPEQRNLHIILEVTDDGEVPVTRYKRVVLHVKQLVGAASETKAHDEL